MWYNIISDMKRDLELDLTAHANKLRRRVECTVFERAKGVKGSRLYRAYIAYNNPDANPYPYPYYQIPNGNSTTQSQSRLLSSEVEDYNNNSFGSHEDREEEQLCWEHGVNLAKVLVKQKEPEMEVGSVLVRVKCAKNLDVSSGKAFFVLELGQYRFVSPFVFEDNRGYYTWEIAITLPICDITADIRVLVYRSNYLFSDRLIGQIMIPLVDFLPNPWLNREQKQKMDKKLKAWFELFPLHESLTKFKPASSKVAGTGMNRPKRSLGKVLIESEVHLKDDAIWPLYLVCKRTNERSLDEIQKSYTIGQVMDKFKDIRRHGHRIEDVLLPIWYKLSEEFKPPRFLEKLRSWEKPYLNLSLLVCSFVMSKTGLSFLQFIVSNGQYNLDKNVLSDMFDISSFFQPWHVPFILYFLILGYSFHRKLFRRVRCRSKSHNAFALAKHDGQTWHTAYGHTPLLWSDQTMDPDAHLTKIQQLGKITHKLMIIEYWLAFIADILERCVNAFTWVDERATLVLLGVLSLVACGVSMIIHVWCKVWCHLPYTFLITCAILFPNNLNPNVNRNRVGSNSEESNAFVFESHSRSRLRSRSSSSSIDAHFRQHARPSLGKSLSTSARNLLSRIPTHDELSHRCIARMQRNSSDYWSPQQPACKLLMVDQS